MKFAVSHPFYIVNGISICYKCSAKIPVITIAGFNSIGSDLTFYNNLTFIDERLVRILTVKFPFYRIGFSKFIQKEYWANHCIYCDALQGDFFLHYEVDGTFNPQDLNNCKELILTPVYCDVSISIEAEFSQNKICGATLDVGLMENEIIIKT
ncbi:MAG: hypothetical protein LBV59_11990 [Sphingobacterium sp.]|jgi:hypothetical protein|uniref:hypothetical protein n=1 Tax=Sphingobacterium sp. TaxID=341027 RepID=UPI00283EDB49|nr:hypothetical protein [Sphingobacterium sp.]MDR3008650.1 hypothetical protein [Sphingobacterium sp.]